MKAFNNEDKCFDLFASVFNSISEAFLLLSLEGEIIFSNKFSQSIFQKNITGHSIEDIFNEDESLGKKIVSIVKGGSHSEIKGELFHLNRGTHSYALFVTLYPHIIDKSIAGWILMLQDYTEQTHSIQQQQRSDLLSSVKQISLSIAHEIKNPLGSMSIHLQLLTKNLQRLDECDDLMKSKKEVMYKCIRVMEEEIENMNNIIGMFLNNFENTSQSFTKCAVNDIINAFIDFIKPMLIQKNIRYTLALTKRNLFIAAIPSLMQHVLLNLVKNAIEEMENGGHITIKTYRSDSRVLISVADIGKGIPLDRHEDIFCPYITSKHHGTGIGLAISDKIMQTHKGSISLDTTYTKGARFILDFPVFANEQHLLSAPILHTSHHEA